MSYSFYSIFHLILIIALSLNLGALWGFYIHKSHDKKIKTVLLALHGIIMFFIFFTGFGLIAKIKLHWPWPFWLFIKLIIWLLLGIMPFLIKKTAQKFQSSKKYFLTLLLPLAFIFIAILYVKLK